MNAAPPASESTNFTDAEFRLSRVFGQTRAPWNVRITERLPRLPLLRASNWWNVCCDWLACSHLLPSTQHF